MMDNLILRKFRYDDFEAFHVAMSDFDVVKMTAHWPWPPEPEFTRSRMVTPQAKSGQVSVIDLAGEYIGQVSVVKGELGYMLSKANWGRGVASWAVEKKLKQVFCETDIQVVTASVWAGNPASEVVLEKFRFRKTASAEDFCKPQGEFQIGYSFELDRLDWEKRDE
jgi:RimJ/RimL family protein N-acetyltransferase